MADIDMTEVREELGALSREEARELSNRWFSNSSETLLAAGDRLDYDVFSVANAAMPPQWDEEQGGYTFEFVHPAAEYLNDGTSTHTVEPDSAEVLAFEWEDAPADVQEMFADTFPTVFFPEVEVEGLPAIRYLEDGRDQAIADMGGGGS